MQRYFWNQVKKLNGHDWRTYVLISGRCEAHFRVYANEEYAVTHQFLVENDS